MTPTLFDATRCSLGEGPLWHPERGELFWFDINNRQMLVRSGGQTRTRSFPEIVTAAGWVDRDTLLVASETALSRVDLNGGAEVLVPLEADDPRTRSNDGRADPQGGFWIGTMGKQAEPGLGAIWRYYRGELRRLVEGISIPNAISFPPGGRSVCWACTTQQKVMRQALDADGWPVGQPEVFIDMTAEDLSPDGAVFDAAGHFWNAQWGASRVAEYDRDGSFLRAIDLPAVQTTCPAFGGPDLRTLFCTSAAQDVAPETPADDDPQGQTFQVEGLGPGQPEHRVVL
ncbi:SMP-30/gluconolactonase/LRE family protein [Frigidibacter sp. ROC022]|uniref:SMP-30/gluconolactonase/LRE family protein n=1 Tax=Frigidibacter sp. ROC022 TaxID=2971796 RepID=UPI00215AB7B4|nr:SMP-30/gluconolactonase/LRE family protein [Frigidibacter sp. ROC022]MCR8726695.1 SMP-30/gluconolactonase/LRE family protein [Frigidibacter sp. ROC022]